jgi:hypothetical protein
MPAFRINILSPSSGLNKAENWSTCIGFEERRLREGKWERDRTKREPSRRLVLGVQGRGEVREDTALFMAMGGRHCSCLDPVSVRLALKLSL